MIVPRGSYGSLAVALGPHSSMPLRTSQATADFYTPSLLLCSRPTILPARCTVGTGPEKHTQPKAEPAAVHAHTWQPRETKVAQANPRSRSQLGQLLAAIPFSSLDHRARLHTMTSSRTRTRNPKAHGLQPMHSFRHSASQNPLCTVTTRTGCCAGYPWHAIVGNRRECRKEHLRRARVACTFSDTLSRRSPTGS